MNPFARWTRRRVVNAVARQLVGEAVLVGAAVAMVLWTRGSLGSQWGLPIVAGELFAVAHLVMAWASNPVSRSFLLEYVETPEALGGVPFDPEHGRDLRSIGLAPSFSLAARVDTDDDAEAELQVAFDVHTAPNQVVVALAGRHSSSLTLVTRLNDGRLAVTADMAIPPHPELVSQRVKGTEPGALAAAHRELLQSMMEQRCRPVATPPEAAWELVTIERTAWESLGPLVGPLFSLSGKDRPWRLGVGIGPDDLPTVSPPAHRGETGSRFASEGRNPLHTTERVPAGV